LAQQQPACFLLLLLLLLLLPGKDCCFDEAPATGVPGI
jgi:hypothetical protein